MPRELWAMEFPGYEVPDAIAKIVAEGLVIDTSWHNDVCPSFTAYIGQDHEVRLWSDHPDASVREVFPQRYCVGVYGRDTEFLTDSVDEAIAELRKLVAEVKEANEGRESSDGDDDDVRERRLVEFETV